MAILKNQEVWFVKLNPARPDKNTFDPTKPNWNLQCRTTSKEVRKEWTDLGIKSRVVRQDKEDEESPILYYSISLRKNAFKVEGDVREKAKPVEVVNGKGEEIDPSTIGNGSICNLRLFKREYKAGGIDKVNYILMGVQVVKHILYVGHPMEEFDECETEVILPADAKEDEDDVY